MKFPVFFLLFSLTVMPAFAQEKGRIVLDSLETLIDTTQSDSIRAANMIEWGTKSRELASDLKNWADSLSPEYLRNFDRAVVFFENRKDTAGLTSILAHIATYNIQTPDSAENHALQRFNLVRGIYGFNLKNTHLLPDSSGEYYFHRTRSGFLVYEDTSKTLTFDEVRKASFLQHFKGTPTNPFGFEKHPRDRVFWLRMKLNSTNFRDDDYFFMVGYEEESWRKIDIYIQDSLDSYTHFLSGNDRRLNEKPIQDWRNKFKIFVPAKESRLVYVRLEHPARVQTPGIIAMSQINSEKIREDELKIQQINSVFFGMVLIQAIFFIFIFATTRIRYYFYYIIFILGVTLAMFVTNYLPFLAPGLIEYMAIANAVIVTLLSIGLLYFAFYFLEVEKLSPHWLPFLRILSITLIVLCTFLCWGMLNSQENFIAGVEGDRVPNTISVIMTTGLIGLISMVYWSIKAHRSGHRTAKFLLIGMVLMLMGVGIPILSAILQNNWFSIDTAILSSQVSVILQLAFFALAIGQQRNQLEADKRNALEEKLGLQEEINAASAKFVPFEFIRSLGKETILDVKLGDATEKEVTVFFSDIRGYTSLVENMSPEENFRFINDFHKTVGPSISFHQGFVNQYLGDGIMAIFLESQDHALQAAIEIQQKVYNYTPLLPENKIKSLKLGMGLHAGSLMMGIIGDDKRTDAATISDTVNTAARMEGLTKYYGAPILLSGEVKAKLSGDYSLRYLGKVQVKGKENSVDVYESLAGRPVHEQELFVKNLPTFQAGIDAYYSRDFTASREAFELILSQNEFDQAAQLYYDKSLLHLKEGVAEDWDGVMMMTDK